MASRAPRSESFDSAAAIRRRRLGGSGWSRLVRDRSMPDGDVQHAYRGSGDSRSCSRIASVADVGCAAPTSLAQAGEGRAVGRRRSGLARPSSFDEAAAPSALAPTEAGLTSRRRGRDRERQRQARNLDTRPKTPRVGGAVRGGPRSRAHQVRAEPGASGNRAPWARHAEAGASSSNEASLDHGPRRGFGRSGARGSSAARRKPRGGVIRESRVPLGARVVMSVAEVGKTHLPRRGNAQAWSSG
jgi:hypothetical protein